jgi:hypothetical protein
MTDIDERYEILYEQWQVAGEPMGSFQMFIFVEYENTLAQVKWLRKELDLYKTRYLKMTEGMDWQEENEMWGNKE